MILKLMQRQGTTYRPTDTFQVAKFRRPAKSHGPHITQADMDQAAKYARRHGFKPGDAMLLLVGSKILRNTWVDHIDEAYAVDTTPITLTNPDQESPNARQP